MTKPVYTRDTLNLPELSLSIAAILFAVYGFALNSIVCTVYLICRLFGLSNGETLTAIDNVTLTYRKPIAFVNVSLTYCYRIVRLSLSYRFPITNEFLTYQAKKSPGAGILTHPGGPKGKGTNE